MGLAPGGRMKQEIYDDPFDFDDWDTAHSPLLRPHRQLAHLAGDHRRAPPTVPPTAGYSKAGLPWFDYYDDGTAVEGSATLGGLKSVPQLGQEKGDVPLPENAPVSGEKVVTIRPRRMSAQVREGMF